MHPAEAQMLLEALERDLPACLTVDRLWAEPRLHGARERLAKGLAIDRTLAECRVRLAQSQEAALRRAAIPLTIEYPEALPVSGARGEILLELAKHGVLVLTGETGSGKTTQLPKMLLEAGCGRRGMIALTQPRRVAAYAMAARIREELRAPGDAVAHSVRFDDRAGEDTLIRVMTDGLLLAEAARDRDLSRYDAIIIDEAHERTLNVDLLLGLVRLLRERRPDLVVAISSASIEVERFAAYLGTPEAPAPIVRVGGRTFPVDVRWRPPSDDDVGYLDAALAAIREVHGDGAPGDVLCFLPTERDILEAARRLHDLGGASVLPLFSRLTPHEQQRVFGSVRGRKVVLATNIAETSLTIPGIVFVVDAGLARIKRYAAGTRTERLPVEAVAQASCIQRAGRAGRIQAGVCIRLYDEQDFAARAAYTDPEILRSNLAGVMLSTLAMGLGDAERIPWLDAPSPQAWQQARVLLEELGALEASQVPRPTSHVGPQQSPDVGRGTWDEWSLTPLGRQMAAIPSDPAVARILLAGIENGCAHEACTIAAFLSVQDPRVRPLGLESKADGAHKAFAHEAGDLATILRLWDRWNAEPSNSARARFAEANWLGVRRMREWADVRHQLWQVLREGPRGGALPPHGHEAEQWPLDPVHRAVLAGMLGNVLMWDRENRTYRATGDRQLAVHPGSALRAGKVDDGKKAPPAPDWLVACEVVETSRLFARLCAPIDPEWIVQLAGDRVKRRHRAPHWHPRRKQVVCTETVLWRGLPVRDGRLVPYERIDPIDATAIFVREALGTDAAEEIGRQLPVIARNAALAQALARLRHRLRDPDLWVDASQLERAYRERLGLDRPGAPVLASTDALARWLKEHGEAALELNGADFVGAEAWARAERLAPETAVMRGVTLPIVHRYAPGEDDDGATLLLREDQVLAVEPARLDWLVPLPHAAMVETWLKQLPKDQRRPLIPLAQSAQDVLAAIQPHAGQVPFADAVHRELVRRVGPCPPPAPEALPPHLRLRFRVVADDGTVLYQGRDPAFVLGQAGAAADRLAPVRAAHGTAPAAAWPEGVERLPTAVTHAGIPAWLALARDRDPAGLPAARVGVWASEPAARAWHEDGVDALLEAALAEDLDRIATAPASGATAARLERALGGRIGALRRGLAVAAALEVERKVRDAASCADVLARARAALPTAAALDQLLDRSAQRVETLRTRLKQGARTLASAGAARAVAADLDRLLGPGWTQRLPWSASRRMDQYLEALGRRLDLAAKAPADAQRIAERAEAAAGEVEHAMLDDTRLLAALGLRAAARDLAAALEDCLYALATPGTGAATGFAERRLREGAEAIRKAVAAERARIRESRERLVAAQQTASRLRAGALRQRLVQEVETLLAGFPEIGLGSDLPAQHAAVQALAERVRGAAGG